MKEADVSTGLPQTTRAGAKPAKPKLSVMTMAEFASKPAKAKESARGISTQVKLRESDDSKPSRFRVTLITEGMGNMADGYYYPGETLQESAPLFEGKKIFANHPTVTEEQEHPERSVQDILGHFENVRVGTNAQGAKILEADVVILPGAPFDYARSLMEHAVEYAKKYPNQDFIGLSINAAGSAEPIEIDKAIAMAPASARGKLQEAKEKGITEIRYVNKITEAHSCDLVTQPGAGGKVMKLLEEAKAKHGPKWEDCVQKVKAGNKKKGGSETDPYNPYAVCTASMGTQKENAVNEEMHKEEEMKKESHKEEEGKEAPAADGDKDGDKDGAKDADKDAKADDKSDEKVMEDKEGDDKADDDHEDAEEDVALFKKLIAEYLDKDGDSASDEEIEAAKEAHKMAEEMYQGDKKEAFKCAGHALKMAHHKAKKIAEAKAVLSKESAASEGKVPSAGVKESAKPSKSVDKLREAEGKIMKLSGENARLKQDLSKFKIQAHLDQKLKESGLPNSATKLFREKAGELKTEKEVDEKLSIFVEAWNEGGRPVTFSLVEAERIVPAGSDDSESASLADCVKN